MVRQTGPCTFDKNGIIKKGTIARHLILPGLSGEAKKIIYYLYTTYHDKIYLSIMNQYTPNKYVKFDELKKPITEEDYDEVIEYAASLGINNAFCQIGETAKDSFIPSFNLEGIKKDIN